MYLFQTPASRRRFSNLFALTFTLLMSGLLFSGQAFAESDDGGLLDFDIDGTNATIIGFTSQSTTTLTIPATVSTGGYTYSVTSINAKAFNNNKLISVTIPSSVTSIGNEAFSHNELTSVLFEGDHNLAFHHRPFHENPSLTLIEAYTNTAGWSEISFTTGDSSVLVTLISPPGPTGPSGPTGIGPQTTDSLPLANAGVDLTIQSTSSFVKVQLDGSGSTDEEDGSSLSSYSWYEGNKKIAAGISPVVTLSNGNLHKIALRV